MASDSNKRSFDIAFKLRVVEYTIQNRSAGRKFGGDEERGREWRIEKDDLQTLPAKKVEWMRTQSSIARDG